MSNLNHIHYATVSDMVANCHAPYAVIANGRQAQQHLTSSRGTNWLGIAGGAAAVAACLVNGFPEGAKIMSKFAEQISAKLPRALGHNRTMRRGDFGDEVDIHSINRGACDKAWTFASRRIKQGSGIVRIAVDIGGNAGQSASSLRWRGIAGMALAHVMEKAGYSVEIVAAFGVTRLYRYAPNCAVSVVVKPRTSRTSIDFLAATIGLTGFFRTFGFAQLHRLADNDGHVADWDLGHYLDVSGVLPVPEKTTQLFVDGSIDDEETALAWVSNSIGLLQHSTITKERG